MVQLFLTLFEVMVILCLSSSSPLSAFSNKTEVVSTHAPNVVQGEYIITALTCTISRIYPFSMPLNKLHWLHNRHIINYYLLYACGIRYSCLLVFHIMVMNLQCSTTRGDGVERCVKTPWLIPASSWEIVLIDPLSNSWALTLSWRSLFAVEC